MRCGIFSYSDEIYEQKGSSSLLMPPLLFSYTFLTTIFLVNLLIAQVSHPGLPNGGLRNG